MDSGECDAHRCSDSDGGGASDNHPPDRVGDLLPSSEGPVEKTPRKDCLVDHLHRTPVPQDGPEREKVIHLCGSSRRSFKRILSQNALNLKIGSNRLANELAWKQPFPVRLSLR